MRVFYYKPSNPILNLKPFLLFAILVVGLAFSARPVAPVSDRASEPSVSLCAQLLSFGGHP